MNFLPIRWTYNPPATVAPPPTPLAPPSVRVGRKSRAGQLLQRVSALRQAALFLEDLIRKRTARIGVEFDLENDPELRLALERIYDDPEPPSTVTVDMYNHMLDAELGILRAEILAEEVDSPLQPSPIQKADLQLATRRVEDALVESGKFIHQLPVVLRELKADRAVFDNMTEGLGQYPILKEFQNNYQAAETVDVQPETSEETFETNDLDFTQDENTQFRDYDPIPVFKDDDDNRKVIRQIVAQAGAQEDAALAAELARPTEDEAFEEDPETDIDPDLAENIDERIGFWESVYGGIYDITATSDAIYSDLVQISETYLYRPLRELGAILSMLASLKAMMHKPKLKDIKATVASLVIPRLIAETCKFNMMLDRLIQKAVNPVDNMLRSFGRLYGEIANITNDVAYLVGQGGFTGYVRSHIDGKYRPPEPQRIQELDTLNKGLRTLTAKLGWSVQEARRKTVFVEASLFKILDRKLDDDGDRLEILKSLRTIDSLIDVTSGFMDVRKAGGTPSQAQDVVRQIQRRLNAGGSSLQTFIATADLQNMPKPNSAAKSVLERGGAQIGDPNA